MSAKAERNYKTQNAKCKISGHFVPIIDKVNNMRSRIIRYLSYTYNKIHQQLNNSIFNTTFRGSVFLSKAIRFFCHKCELKKLWKSS